MLLTSDSLADLEQCESIWNFVDGLWKIHKKFPSLKGGPGASGGLCGSLIKNSAGVELPLWRLSHSLQGLMVWAGLGQRGDLHLRGVFSRPMRARAAA